MTTNTSSWTAPSWCWAGGTPSISFLGIMFPTARRATTTMFWSRNTAPTLEHSVIGPGGGLF
ncbi:MAG: hypothetical protein ACLSAF_20145 [Intestinimonas sp.]